MHATEDAEPAKYQWRGSRAGALWRGSRQEPQGEERLTGTNAIGPRLADDPEAFQEAYEHLSPMVLDYVRRFVPRDEAEDVRQQVFLEVWRSRSRFDADRKLEPWVLAIAKRRSIDHIRRQARNLSDPVEVLPARRIETEPHFVDTITEADEMRAALAELSEDQRATLELAYYEGMTQAEIATELGVPLGTVKARSFRGLRKLAELLVPKDEPELEGPHHGEHAEEDS